jgi:cytochrome c peroxidase
VGIPFNCEAAVGSFSDPKGSGLTYRVTFSPSANGLTAVNGRIAGAPAAPGVVTARVTAVDVKGDSAVETISIVTFAAGLPSPALPPTSFGYSDASSPLPLHFRGPSPGPGGPAASVIATDNTPATNPTTDAGATLGRILFYDTRLSANDAQSCATCHQQAFGFSDTARFSRGFTGGRTTRHAPGLSNARFYQRGAFFWDERAASLEAQVLMPIQNPVEMGMTLENLVLKVGATTYYPELFRAAFGTPEVSSDRISRALAQFVRSMVSAQSRFDSAFVGGPSGPNFGVLTPQEQQGQQLFVGPAGCAACHATAAVVSDNIHNNGLDAVPTDTGAGHGRFKAPSLRNVAVRAPYMHDGRFQTLRDVVDFYDHEVQSSQDLDVRLRGPNGVPRRLGLAPAQRDALVAYLRALTDSAFLTAPKLSDPFRR